MQNPSTDSLKPLKILSLGAGVQSSVVALQSEIGVLPKLDCAIFSDTGGEPKRVMEYLDYLEDQLSFPVYRVMEKEGLTSAIFSSAADNTRLAGPPFFTLNPDGTKGKLFRGCTSEYKIKPIERKIRELLGLEKGERAGNYVRVIQWFGISYDEIQRVREPSKKWIDFYYPLVESRMTRSDCLNWMSRMGFKQPPRSACTYCPYHSDTYWKGMKEDDPESWSEAVEVDKAIRDGVRGTTSKLFLHRSLEPLDEVDLKTETHPDQETFNFGDECEGMCGN